MSVNKNRPHVLVLPEDDANRQIANGFQLEPHGSWARQFQILPVAGGWIKVVECFEQDHIRRMAQLPERSLVLLIDLDGQEERIQHVKGKIPNDVADRVFVIGSLIEPENLKADLGTPETIGRALAEDCRQGTNKTWSHRHLLHKAQELETLARASSPHSISLTTTSFSFYTQP
jgi:hypothetical protein